jgi:hypothetical protein
MSRIRFHRRLAAVGGALTLLLALAPASFGQESCGDNCCNWLHCPPFYKYCAEGPPRICVKCACPKPVCCPSGAPNWGYYPTQWRPFPWPQDCSYGYGNPPAAQMVPPFAHTMPLHDVPPSQLPPPKTLGSGLKSGF